MAGERGRPRVTTAAAIVDAAFELFRETGFEATTPHMIATRAGIGRTTLFRYFPSKAAILWYSQVEKTEELRTALAAQPDGIDLADGAFSAYRSIWDVSAHDAAIGREMVRTIETAPPDATGKWQQYEAWTGLIHDYVLARTGRPRSDTAARAAASAIWSAIWSAVSAYALDDARDLDEELRAARAAIDVPLAVAART